MITEILALTISLRKWTLVVIVSLFFVIIVFGLELVDDLKKLYDSRSLFDFFDVGKVIVRNFPKDKEERNLEKEFNSSDMKRKDFNVNFKPTMFMLSISFQILNEKEPHKVINNTD